LAKPDNMTVFFVSFFKHLFKVLPEAELKLPPDIRGRSGIMSRVIGFIVEEGAHLDDKDTIVRVRQLMVMHNKMG